MNKIHGYVSTNNPVESSAHVRFIGDLHGASEFHLDLIRDIPYSVQIGDLGFNYDYLQLVDANKHKFIGGNHDNYDILKSKPGVPHDLGNFGVYTIPDFGDIFFVRGAFSIDHKRRLKFGPLKSHWEEEELSNRECMDALALYEKVKPKFLISHDAPNEIHKHVGNPGILMDFGFPPNLKTRTSLLLQSMLDVHCPKIHIFGHHHYDFDVVLDGKTGHPDNLDNPVRFICLGIASYIDFPKDYIQSL